LDGGIDAMRVQEAIGVMGKKPHQVLGFEPQPFVPNGAPEKDQRARIHLPGCMSEGIQLVCFPKTDAVLRHRSSDRVCAMQGACPPVGMHRSAHFLQFAFF
jgi:hypothetical protein